MQDFAFIFGRIISALALWAARVRERRHLHDLDDHLLADLGLTRDDARAEGRRPPWSGRDRRYGDYSAAADSVVASA
ncbi:MAG: DUF1127 domain-containing protein, partial [Propylenella sp.]